MTVKLPTNLFPADAVSHDSEIDLLRKYQAEFSLNPIAPHDHSVFRIDQALLRPPAEKSSHWSVAWSDLMMTMFILFLCLFVYQATHEQFLKDKNPEVIAGKIRDAEELTDITSKNTFPFVVIKPSAPLITSGTVKKVEAITLQDINLDAAFSSSVMEQTSSGDGLPAFHDIHKSENNKIIAPSLLSQEPVKQVIQPLPLGIDNNEKASVNSIYSQSRRALETYDLNEFAKIDLVPDKAVRIALTSDLIFETGQASLSHQAISSLEKIASAISNTSHQIHIEGHTDDVPILGGLYANNWELSLARANAVAVFLINDMKMNPQKMVISGYSSYRPLAPNTSEANRAKNRRVEIVISQGQPNGKEIVFDSQTSAYMNL